MTYKIKLKPGDYCRRDMGEDKYREVAQRFFDDGCPEGEHVGMFGNFSCFGWYCGNITRKGFFHGDKKYFSGRLLTYEQIMERSEEYKKLEQNYDAYKSAITNTEKEPMQDIWKDAPEGATHISENNFYKLENGKWYCWQRNQKYWFVSTNDDDFFLSLIERPKPDKPWRETGELPPVGECEISINDEDYIWCRIVHHSGSASWIVTHSEDRIVRNDLCKFRPIKSEKEKAIEEIKKIVVGQGWLSSDGTVSGEIARSSLYDAGYRKVE